MKKLSLNPDSLRVQTFSTGDAAPTVGTVNGYVAPSWLNPSACGTCSCPPTVVVE